MRPASLALALAVALATLPLAAARASAVTLADQLNALAGSFDGGLSVWVSDPSMARPLYTRDADERVPTASLYKLAVLAAVEREVDRGTLRYDDTIVIEPDDITADGAFEDPGTVMTVDAALEAMITVSDNGPAVHFLRTLGPSSVDALLVSSGISGFRLSPAFDGDNTATARAVGTYFTLLARGALVSPAASARMLARLARQRINDRLPALLPSGTVVAHKTGDLAGIVHDAGIVVTPHGQRVVVALTRDAGPDAASALIAQIGSAVYDDAIARWDQAFRRAQDRSAAQVAAMRRDQLAFPRLVP